MNVGSKDGRPGVSAVCARIVQVSYGMRRKEILRYLEQFGQVVGIHFEAAIKGGKFTYKGI
eukprot:5026242-Karenia_brevis.AAC.1